MTKPLVLTIAMLLAQSAWAQDKTTKITTTTKVEESTPPKKAEKPQKAEEPEIVSSWPLTFAHSSIFGPLNNGVFSEIHGLAPNELATGLQIRDAMKELFGVTIQAMDTTLLIKGTPDAVKRTREFLAKEVDIPYPVVRLDFWVFQGSDKPGHDAEIASQVETIERGVGFAKAYGTAVRLDFEEFLRNAEFDEGALNSDPTLKYKKDKLLQIFNDFRLLDPIQSVEPGDRWHALMEARSRVSTTAELLAMACAYKREGFVNRYRCAMANGVAARTLSQATSDMRKGLAETREPGAKRVLTDLLALAEKLQKTKVFGVYAHLMESQNMPVETNTILGFLDAYRNCPDSVDPELLTVMSSSVDRALKNALDASYEDYRQAVVQPLREWITEIGSRRVGGRPFLMLNGATSLNVSSSRPAASAVSTESAFPYTPPKQVTDSDFDAFAKALGQGTSTPVVSSETALALFKALTKFGQNQTTYTTVAQGLDVSVRPVVLPGARTARLIIRYRFGVDADSKFPNTAGMDRVTNQTVETDVSVEQQDLFTLNTFGIETSTLGDYTWRIPVLEGLPFFGQMFHGPRGISKAVHRGLTVVSVGIQPRTMDLARRYVPEKKSEPGKTDAGRDQNRDKPDPEPKKTSKQDSHEKKRDH